jgi:polyhydroxyalkanoate synthesis repressor PhaR
MRRARPRPARRHKPAEEPRHALGKVGIGRHGRELLLPQVEIPLGQAREVRRFRHGAAVYRRPPAKTSAARPLPQPGCSTLARMLICYVNRRPKGRERKRHMDEKSGAGTPPVVIKKYANRRLYNTATSSYVTLNDLAQMVKSGREFVVYDAKSDEEITRAVLTQIIVEEEAKGQNLLPISFLRQLISLYGDSMQWLVPRYLDHAMSTFSRNQEQMRKNLQETFGGLFPFGPLEEMGKQNLALFEKTMKMFSPFPAPGKGGAGDKPADGQSGSEAGIKELTEKLNALQQQLDALSKDKKE